MAGSESNFVVMDSIHTKVRNFTIKWIIEDFKKYQYINNPLVIESSHLSFKTADEDYNDAHLELRSDPQDKINSLYFVPSRYNFSTFEGKLKAMIINRDGSPSWSDEVDMIKTTRRGPGWGFMRVDALDPCLVNRNGLHLQTDGSLKMIWEVELKTHLPEEIDEGMEDNPASLQPSKVGCASLSIGLWEMFKTETNTDVTLVVDREEIKVHKLVLAAHSRVFAAMFQSDMKEAHTGRIVMKDYTAHVIHNLLFYMYCGRVKDRKTYAELLLEIANKYEMDGLKEMCSAYLIASLKVDNAAQRLLLATYHCADNLKRSTVGFIRKNMPAVKMSLGWIALKKSHPILIVEAIVE